jgi:hypothetical protein
MMCGLVNLTLFTLFIAGWSSLVARQAHNLKVAGSNPAPAPFLVIYGHVVAILESARRGQFRVT